MKQVFKLWLKISWAVSLLLGFFWIGCGIYSWFNNNSDLAGKSYLMALFWLGLSYVAKKVTGENLSYKKISQVCAYIYAKAPNKTILNPLRLVQLMFLSDYAAAKKFHKALFPHAPWTYTSHLDNKIAQFWADKSSMFAKLAAKGLDPSFMVPPIDCSPEELQLIEEVLLTYQDKTAYEMQQIVYQTYPLREKIAGPWDLVALSQMESHDPPQS